MRKTGTCVALAALLAIPARTDSIMLKPGVHVPKGPLERIRRGREKQPKMPLKPETWANWETRWKDLANDGTDDFVGVRNLGVFTIEPLEIESGAEDGASSSDHDNKKSNRAAVDAYIEENEGHCTGCFGAIFSPLSSWRKRVKRITVRTKPPAITRGISPPSDGNGASSGARSGCGSNCLSRMIEQRPLLGTGAFRGKARVDHYDRLHGYGHRGGPRGLTPEHLDRLRVAAGEPGPSSVRIPPPGTYGIKKNGDKYSRQVDDMLDDAFDDD